MCLQSISKTSLPSGDFTLLIQTTSTLIRENDIMKTDVDYKDNFISQVLSKFFIEGHEMGNCTFLCSHNKRRRKYIFVHGVIISGQCYLHPLLLPDLPTDHPMATMHNLSALALATDPVFARKCNVAHVKSIVSYHQTTFAELDQQLVSVPDNELKKALEKVPFRWHITDSTSINALHDNCSFWGLILFACQSNRFQPLLLGVDIALLEFFDCPLNLVFAGLQYHQQILSQYLGSDDDAIQTTT